MISINLQLKEKLIIDQHEEKYTLCLSVDIFLEITLLYSYRQIQIG